MSVIAVTSASGSPGVTTIGLGLALRWRRPVVLVDADPVGGSAVLAGYFGGAVAHNDAMVELAIAHREGRLNDKLPRVLLPLPGGSVRFLPGPRSHGQAAGLTDLWVELVHHLRALDQDVLVDVGRLGMRHSPTPILDAADLVLMLTRSDLPSLSAARQWTASQSDGGDSGHSIAAPVDMAVLLVGEGQPYTRPEVERVLGVPVLDTVADDPATAGILSRGSRQRSRGAGTLWRDLGVVAAGIDKRLNAARSLVEVAS